MTTLTDVSPEESSQQAQFHATLGTVLPAVIVGGGMVGLSLALMLAQKGIVVTLLESVQYPADMPGDALPEYYSSFDARNTALSRRTVGIYTELGLWPALQQHAMPIYEVNISEQGGFGRARLLAEAEKVESFGQVIENAWLGRVLLAAVRAEPRIKLVDGTTLERLVQQGEHVTLMAKRKSSLDGLPATDLTLTSRLVIAADGRDSRCRQLLGIGAQVHDYKQVALVTTVQTSQPHQHVAFERFTPAGPLALLPLPSEYRRSVVWTVAAGTEHEWLGAANDAHFLQALQKSFGGRAGQFVKTGARFAYPLTQVLAEQQAIGRVVLMGNAAHTLHPVAGQGFNLCMRDADVLSRLLAQKQQAGTDLGEPGSLVAYEQARLTDQKRVIRFCDSVVRGFSTVHPIIKLARNTGLMAFEHFPGAKQWVAQYAMGLKV